MSKSKGTLKTAPLHVRFHSRYTVNEATGCWEWAGSKDSHGYGQIRHEGKLHPAHRVSYELHVGPIPDGLRIDHLCRVPSCVNPAHLEPVTTLENSERSPFTAKSHCIHGHALTLDNQIRRTTVSGYRRYVCRTCSLIQQGRLPRRSA